MSTPVLSSAPSFGVSPVAGQLTQYLQQHIQLNPQQHEACYTPATQGLQVLAGAGTGKTMLITARTLYLMDTLLAEGIADPESRLLVLTFTKDAAREMKERIHHHLQKAGWQGALPQENVSNFHSFCMGFLKRHLLELGLPTGFSLLDEAEQAKVRAKLQRLLEANQLNNIHSTLQQVGLAEGVPKACLSIDSLKQQPFESVDALVQAWLGVIQRAKALGWSPREFWVHTRQQTLALAEMFKTLPPTASDTVELMHAWRSKVGAWASPEWVYSFEEAQCVDEKSLYKQLRDAHFGHLWKTKFCLEEGGRGNKLPAPKLPDWQAFDVQVQAELRLIDQVAAFYALYQQELRLQGALDFDDLINETVRILSTHSEIRYRYQQQFKAVLVDEFQDTNGSQLALLRLLSTLPSTAKDPCNITVVGDAKQSIYGFRFAQKENLSLIFDALPPETFRCVTLTQNYRSLPPVVAAANTVAHHVTLGDASAVYEKPLQAFQSLPSHDASSSSPPPEWVQWWQFVTPKKDDPELYSPLSRTERGIQALMGDLEQHQRHTPNFHYGQVCMLVQTHSEAARIAEALEERHIPYLLSQDASFFQAPAVKNLLALLRLLAEPNHQASWARLLQWQLPKTTLLCLWHTVQRFLHQPEAFLTIEQTQTVLNQPLNQRWLWVWQALLNGEVTLTPVQLAQLPQGLDTLLTALAPQENMPRLPVATWMNDLAHWFQRFQTEPTLPTLQALLTYWDTSLPTASAFQREQNKLLMQQVWLLVHQHSSLAQRKRKLRLSDICTELERLAKDERVQLPSVVKAARHQGQATPAVQLMTVHASKGLEFPHVYVWWLGKGNNRSDALLFEPQYEGKAGFGLILKQNQSPNRAFPLVKPALWHDVWEAPRREREKERLFYVALTRAKQTLRVLVPASTVGDEKAWHTPEALYRLNEVTIYNEWEDLSHFEALCVLANASLQTAQQRTKHSHKHLQGESDPQETVATVHPAQTVASALPTHGDPWLQRRGQKPWNLSYSNMQRWQRCPTLFYFQDVLRLPTPVSLNPRPSSPQEYRNHLANLRGVAIHTCLEQYYLTQGEAEAWPRQRDRLAQQFQQQWQQTSLGQTALTLQEATDLWQQVATALQAFEATPYNISTLQQEAVTWLAPEQRLTLPLPLSLMLGSESVPQPVQLTATLDALFFYPSTGVLQVVDFKVQEAISPQQHHAHHQQLALYAAALPALLPPTSGVRQLQLNTVQYQHQRQAWVCHTHDTRCLEANTFTGVAVAQQQVLPLVKPFIDALQTLLQQPADAIPTPWPATTPPCATCRYASVCPHGGR